MEVRKADSKDTVYIGRALGGEESVKDEIVGLLDVLGEPSVEDIKEVVERSKRRMFSSLQA